MAAIPIRKFLHGASAVSASMQLALGEYFGEPAAESWHRDRVRASHGGVVLIAMMVVIDLGESSPPRKCDAHKGLRYIVKMASCEEKFVRLTNLRPRCRLWKLVDVFNGEVSTF